MQGAPLDLLLRDVKSLRQFERTTFLFLLDEYENYDESQQRVLNTLIKHCGEFYSFKVGVREFGILQRSTLSQHEHIAHPADYRLIDINKELDGRFTDFAASVCNQRMSAVFGGTTPNAPALFPELPPEHEAVLLGVKTSYIAPLIQRLHDHDSLDADAANWFRSVHPLEAYTLFLRAEAEGLTPIKKLSQSLRDHAKWRQQYENYKYAYLFTLRKGKARHPKTLLWLDGVLSTRLVKHTVYVAAHRPSICDCTPMSIPISHQLHTIFRPRLPTPPHIPTFLELQSRAMSGAKLTRLLLSLGRVFQVMSENPVGHTPEVNQFHLFSSVPDRERHSDIVALLKRRNHAPRVPVVIRQAKLQQTTDLRDFDYAIHPLFSSFFWF